MYLDPQAAVSWYRALFVGPLIIQGLVDFFCTCPRQNPHFMYAHCVPHCDAPGYCPAYTIRPPSRGFLLFPFTGPIFSVFLGILGSNHPSNPVMVVLVSPHFRVVQPCFEPGQTFALER